MATIPSDGSTNLGIYTLYYFHCWDDNPLNLFGSAVISVDRICTTFKPIANTNIFCHYCGIKFCHNGHTYVCAISPFKFVSCFHLLDKITYKLLHPSNVFCMYAAVPALTSACMFEHILERCLKIWSLNIKILQPNQYAAPAICVQAFLNGSIRVCLPGPKQWADAYYNDPETATIIEFVQNPGTIFNKGLEDAKLNANFCMALHQSHLMMEDGFLIYHKPIAGSKSYACLLVVPTQLQYIIFIAFHRKPVGSLSTPPIHSIPSAYTFTGPICTPISYITRMCHSCPGYALSNPTCGKSHKLIYNFPIEAPMMVLHIDSYQAGNESGFEGSSHYLIACCGMCKFSVMEPISNANATA